jgi:predicted ATPase
MTRTGRSPSASASTLRFTRLLLENWRNFRAVDVGLEQRVFLVGPNASGKSNFLDVFRFSHDIVAVGGGLQAAVDRRGGVSALRSLAARRTPEIRISVSVGDAEERQIWSYELAFSSDTKKRAAIRYEKIMRDTEILVERPDRPDEADPERLTQTSLEQVTVNRSFRELVDFFESVRYLHLVPQLVREPDRSVGRIDDPYGGDFLEQLARTPERTRNARLRRIRDALRVAVPQLEELELSRDVRGTPHLRGKYSHWRLRGAWQSEDQFSDGTLRLMGLLWALLEGTGPLLLEEPELSLHADVVRFIPQMMSGVQRRNRRQILLSSHSGDLLQDPGIGLDEVLLLEPAGEGTEVRPVASLEEVKPLLDGGMPLPEAVIPRTRPKAVEQLALFGRE